jgi:hypothetical protein
MGMRMRMRMDREGNGPMDKWVVDKDVPVRVCVSKCYY